MAGSVAASLVAFYAATVAPVAVDAALKRLTVAAWGASLKGLKSGVGEGVYERGEGGNIPPVRYVAKVSHLGPKFHVELTHLDGGRPGAGPSKLVLIYDGETLACREVNALLRPHGEEAKLYPVPDGNVRRHAQEVDFRFNPANLPSAVFDLPAGLARRPDMAFRVGPDDVSASVPFPEHPELLAVVRFPKAAGYNVGAYEVARKDNGYRQHAVARWDRAGGAWYVREVETRFDSPEHGRRYQRLRYTAFEPNAMVDPTLFRLPALGLLPKARLLHIDVRSQAVDAYTNDPPAGAGKAGDSLLDGLRRLPLRDWIRPAAPAPREVAPRADGR